MISPPDAATRHPSPHADRVGLVALMFAVFGAPFAWAGQLIVNYALAAEACFPADTPLNAPTWAGLSIVLWVINIAAMLVSLAAAAVALRAWRLTREEHPGGAAAAVDAGEGRTRFMALCGLMTGGGFLFAIVFNTVALIGAPRCVG